MKIPFDILKLVPFVSGLIKLWAKTIRFEVHGDFQAMLKQSEEEPLVVALWHGELFPVVAFAHEYGDRFCVIVSQSKDGEFITRVLERLGVKGLRGSSSKGGVRALLQGKRVMEREKRICVFTVDGPRGPRHKPKDGVVFMAQRAGAKICPVRAYSEKMIVFEKSWDKFNLPLPFTKCRFYIGDFITVTDEKLDKDVMAREKERLEKYLLALGAEK